MIAFLPLLGGIIFTRPILTGVMVGFVVRGVGVRPIYAVLGASVPVIALVSINLLLDERAGIDVSGKYRAFVWVAVTVMYVVFTTVGALLGRRTRLAI